MRARFRAHGARPQPRPEGFAARYRTFAATEALPPRVKVQLRALALEHAPDQLASREAVSVTDVPVANVAVPLLPTATLMPAGEDVMRSPLRPVADTVS